MAILAILAGALNALYMLLGGEMPNWQDVMLLIVGIASLFGVKAASKGGEPADRPSAPTVGEGEGPAPDAAAPVKPNTDAAHGPRR